MAAEFLFAGDVARDLLKELGKLCKDACFAKDAAAARLKLTVEDLLPVVREVQYSGVDLPDHRRHHLSSLLGDLQSGRDLVRKAHGSSRWNLYRSHLLSKKMERLEKSISRFMTVTMQAHLVADVHHIRSRVAEVGGVGRLVEGAGEEAAVVGGGMRVGKEWVKKVLMVGTEEVRVVGISGTGGSGKTTLAQEICRDQAVKSMLFFFSVLACCLFVYMYCFYIADSCCERCDFFVLFLFVPALVLEVLMLYWSLMST